MSRVRITKIEVIKLCVTCNGEHEEGTECEGVLEEVGWIEQFDCD